MDLDQIEIFLQDTIFPELEKGRPNWDKPHTICVVDKIKAIIEASPELNLDKTVLIIAAYAHDWGYADLFEGGKPLTLEMVNLSKKKHMESGEIKIRELLKYPIFAELSIFQIERICHLVKIHDEVELLHDIDEIVLMEADTLGGLDTDYVKPDFDEESNQKYINGVINKRLPKFITEYSKSQVKILIEKRLEFYR